MYKESMTLALVSGNYHDLIPIMKIDRVTLSIAEIIAHKYWQIVDEWIFYMT